MMSLPSDPKVLSLTRVEGEPHYGEGLVCVCVCVCVYLHMLHRWACVSVCMWMAYVSHNFCLFKQVCFTKEPVVCKACVSAVWAQLGPRAPAWATSGLWC